jgi:hypothetical protein
MASTNKIGPEWFELRNVRRKKFAESVWVPLRLSHQIERTGKYGFVGFKEEFSGAGSLAIPLGRREQALKLGWDDIGLSHTQGVWRTASFIRPPRHTKLARASLSEYNSCWFKDLIMSPRNGTSIKTS